MGWHLTCEKLLGVKTPKRVDYLRVIIMELARISDHLICNSIVGVDSGAFTGFLYVMQYRELIYEIYEEDLRIAAHDQYGPYRRVRKEFYEFRLEKAGEIPEGISSGVERVREPVYTATASLWSVPLARGRSAQNGR